MVTRFRETYVKKTTNAAQLNAGVKIYIDYITDAKLHGNLPHNVLTVGNQDTTCTLFIWLDNDIDAENPDYILYPNQIMSISPEEGVSYQTLIIKNTHASSNISANAIKIRVATAKVI